MKMSQEKSFFRKLLGKVCCFASSTRMGFNTFKLILDQYLLDPLSPDDFMTCEQTESITLKHVYLNCEKLNKMFELPVLLEDVYCELITCSFINSFLKIEMKGAIVKIRENKVCPNSHAEILKQGPSPYSDTATRFWKMFDGVGEAINDVAHLFNILLTRSDVTMLSTTLIYVSQGLNDPNEELSTTARMEKLHYCTNGWSINPSEMLMTVSLSNICFCFASSKFKYSDKSIRNVEFRGNIKIALHYIPTEPPKYSLDIKCDAILGHLQVKHINVLKEQVESLMVNISQTRNIAVDVKNSLMKNELHNGIQKSFSEEPSTTSKYNLVICVDNICIALLYKDICEESSEIDSTSKYFNFFPTADTSTDKSASTASYRGILNSSDPYSSNDHIILFANHVQVSTSATHSGEDINGNLNCTIKDFGIQEKLYYCDQSHDMLSFIGNSEMSLLDFRIKFSRNNSQMSITGPHAEVCIDLSFIERVGWLLEQCGIVQNEGSSNSSNGAHKIELWLSFPFVTVNLYFPVPDYRPISDIDVFNQFFRSDYLLLNFNKFDLGATFNTEYEAGSELVTFVSENIEIFYKEMNVDRILIGNIFQSKFTINMPPENVEVKSSVELSPIVSAPSHCYGIEMHPKVPINKKKMRKFVKHHVQGCYYQLIVNVSEVNIGIPSKNILELLYNRLFSDLILWQPQTFRTNTGPEQLANEVSTKTIFASTIGIKKMMLSARTPCRNPDGSVISNEYGDVVIEGKDIFLSILVGFNGDINVCYTLFEIPSSLCLYHGPKSDVESLLPSCNIPIDSFYKVLTTGEISPMIVSPANVDCDQALSLVVKTEFLPVENISAVEVIGQFKGCVYQHFMQECSDLGSQLLSMLILEYYPIEGYIPPQVLTDIQLSVHHPQIDYIPSNLDHATRIILTNANVIVSSDLEDNTTVDIWLENLYVALAQKRPVLVCDNYVPVLKLCADGRQIFGRDQFTSLNVNVHELEFVFCGDSLKAASDLVTHLSSGYGSKAEALTSSLVPIEHYSALDVGQGAGIHTDTDINVVADQIREASVDIHIETSAAMGTNLDLAHYDMVDDAFVENPISSHPKRSHCPTGMRIKSVKKVQVNMPVRVTHRCELNVPKKLKARAEQFKRAYMNTSEEKKSFLNIENLPKQTEYPKPQFTVNLKAKAYLHFFLGKDFPPKIECNTFRIAPNKSPGFSTPRNWLLLGGAARDKNARISVAVDNLEAQKSIFSEDQSLQEELKVRVHRIMVDDHIAGSCVMTIFQVTKKMPVPDDIDMIQLTVREYKSESNEIDKELAIRLQMIPLDLCIHQEDIHFIEDFHAELLPITNKKIITVQPEITRPVEDSIMRTHLRKFEFHPAIFVDVSYTGKQIEMRANKSSLTSILLGLGVVDARITLKRITLTNRDYEIIYSDLLSELSKLWREDIKAKQASQLLSGIEPLGIFISLYQGLKDLFCLPIAQYQQDGRVFRGLQKGANSFAYSTTHAILILLERTLSGVQTITEILDDIVSGNPQRRVRARRKVHAPDVGTGVTDACRKMWGELERTTIDVIGAAAADHSERGIAGAVGTILRNAPRAITEPTLALTEAAHTIVGSAKSQLTPHELEVAKARWKQ